jgi:hypothetical protein
MISNQFHHLYSTDTRNVYTSFIQKNLRNQNDIWDTKLSGTNFKIILKPSELETSQKPDTVCVTK